MDSGVKKAARFKIHGHDVAAATVIDAGIDTPGSLAAGIWMSQLCMSDLAKIDLCRIDPAVFAAEWGVSVRTDDPVAACLASQYAGWPVSAGDYFAMGSGPMRLARGREPMLEQLSLVGTAETLTTPLVGILESDKMPTPEVIQTIADQCDVTASHIHLAIAPSFSIAGTMQVVARSIETAMHKLHELHFDVAKIVSAAGTAPLPTPAKRGDIVGGIGRTNDAILYGGDVTFWTDAEDDVIADLIGKVPSSSSSDYGRPFAETFKSYDYDFYKVDPMLFSPARVTMRSTVSGRTFSAGSIDSRCLTESFA